MKELIQAFPAIRLQKTESIPSVDKKWWKFWK
jgi:hypothetical protein